MNGSLLHVYNGENIREGVDVSTLSGGMYILKIFDKAGNPVAAHKFVK